MTERESVTRLRASYTVAEVAEMLSLSRKATILLLERQGITIDRSVNIWRVWVADMQRCAPRVWDSITFVKAVNG